ncbi:WD40/YVTN/BNR-like repeat-containing protein [Cohnella soli]|uniref:WD40/YVTN/BNR-like repeat-containing protein n=1 Tax=Cohnella soli TaxID=425005 RepID=A0ABW0HX47_9BACL
MTLGNSSNRLLAVWLTVLLTSFAMAGCTSANTKNAVETTSASASIPASADSQPPATASEPTSAPESAPASEPASPEPAPAPEQMAGVTALRLVDFKSGWAGGDGWIARTDDGGKTWNRQWSDRYTANELFALNGREAWAALGNNEGENKTLLHTSDGGKKWAEAGALPNSAFLHFVSSAEGFSGNAHTKDGGRSWHTYKLPDNVVGDTYFHDSKEGWAVSQTDGQINFLRTTDEGANWKQVNTMKTAVPATNAIIRSGGKGDAWIVLIGDSGMSQTSYSLFHTKDAGKHWQPVLANNQAGSGPAPGYEMNAKTQVPSNTGSAPGPLYVVNRDVAFMGGVCSACDLPNTMGKTTDGGKTWINLKPAFPGYGQQLIAAADAKQLWWVLNDPSSASVLYVSSDGGNNWSKAHTFAKPG